MGVCACTCAYVYGWVREFMSILDYTQLSNLPHMIKR